MKNGIICAILSYFIWGTLPIYWKLIENLGAFYIISSRIFWSVIVSIFLVIIYKGSSELKSVIKNRKKLIGVFLASIFVYINWFVYIYAITVNKVIETSMGYFMTPLVVILISTVVFKEKLSKMQWVSIAFAFVGVLVTTFEYGIFPYIALSIAVSFSLYGTVKKINNISPIVSLAMETVILLPIALPNIVFCEIHGTGAFSTGNIVICILVMLSGFATLVPLLLYSHALKVIPFNTVGFFQYITPTLTLLLGTLLYNEKITHGEIIAFVFIWIGLAIFIYSKILEIKKSKV